MKTLQKQLEELTTLEPNQIEKLCKISNIEIVLKVLVQQYSKLKKDYKKNELCNEHDRLVRIFQMDTILRAIMEKLK